MESAWKRRTGGNPEYNAKYAIARDAFLSNCMIYSTATGQWYTPEEFMKTDSEKISVHRGKDDADKFKVMDPRAGLKQKLGAAARAVQDLSAYIAKIDEYFDFINKPGRRKQR
jgi:hypothetical protein